MTHESSSPAPDVRLTPGALRIIRAIQPSGAHGETAECVANHASPSGPRTPAFEIATARRSGR